MTTPYYSPEEGVPVIVRHTDQEAAMARVEEVLMNMILVHAPSDHLKQYMHGTLPDDEALNPAQAPIREKMHFFQRL